MALVALKAAVAGQIGRSFPRLWLERELRFRREHFERELWLAPIFCDREKTAIDVGANEGSYSYYMAKYARRVVAFEPNADLWPHLRRLMGKNFSIEPFALSGRCSTTVMRIDRGNTGVGTIEEKNELSCVEDRSAVVLRTVETKTLDSFGIADVSLIKIDVEGHEESVIEGAWETIERNRPVLIIESEDRHNPGAPRRLSAALAKVGYCGFYLKGQRLMDFDTLSERDTNPANLATGGAYINNFLFIPSDQKAKIEQVRTFLAASGTSDGSRIGDV